MHTARSHKGPTLIPGPLCAQDTLKALKPVSPHVSNAANFQHFSNHTSAKTRASDALETRNMFLVFIKLAGVQSGPGMRICSAMPLTYLRCNCSDIHENQQRKNAIALANGTRPNTGDWRVFIAMGFAVFLIMAYIDIYGACSSPCIQNTAGWRMSALCALSSVANLSCPCMRAGHHPEGLAVAVALSRRPEYRHLPLLRSSPRPESSLQPSRCLAEKILAAENLLAGIP